MSQMGVISKQKITDLYVPHSTTSHRPARVDISFRPKHNWPRLPKWGSGASCVIVLLMSYISVDS